MDQVHFLVQKLLKGKLPSRMKRCIKWNLSPDMNSTKKMQLCLRKRLEHDYERRKSTIGRSQLSILLLVGLYYTCTIPPSPSLTYGTSYTVTSPELTYKTPKQREGHIKPLKREGQPLKKKGRTKCHPSTETRIHL